MTAEPDCIYADDPEKICDEEEDLFKIVYDDPKQTVLYACNNHVVDIIPLG